MLRLLRKLVRAPSQPREEEEEVNQAENADLLVFNPDEYIEPDLDERSQILTWDETIFLDKQLPNGLVCAKWRLKYSTQKHGYALNTLYRKLHYSHGPMLLILQDNHGHRFGAFLTHCCRPDRPRRSYGHGHCFLFRLKNQDLAKKYSRHFLPIENEPAPKRENSEEFVVVEMSDVESEHEVISDDEEDESLKTMRRNVCVNIKKRTRVKTRRVKLSDAPVQEPNAGQPNGAAPGPNGAEAATPNGAEAAAPNGAEAAAPNGAGAAAPNGAEAAANSNSRDAVANNGQANGKEPGSDEANHNGANGNHAQPNGESNGANGEASNANRQAKAVPDAFQDNGVQVAPVNGEPKDNSNVANNGHANGADVGAGETNGQQEKAGESNGESGQANGHKDEASELNGQSNENGKAPAAVAPNGDASRAVAANGDASRACAANGAGTAKGNAARAVAYNKSAVDAAIAANKNARDHYMYNYDLNRHHVFKWDEKEDYFIICDRNMINIGLHDGTFGLTIFECLTKGNSMPCKVFNNECLAPNPVSEEDFQLVNVEAYVFRDDLEP